ncbi:hypothetical protein MAXJ12_12547 [Mesorhizobium alhagi CCNWXJ12-2]|uniref:Uncharacterized protein n=2 Tax=Allomesorhizobium alhagi TaxID=475067 RepID=H0HQS9_9HYPH|nr:hypothetical protein MAXJ12_12547 [Mesorhizobium alhagi CCNWXJ12-2]
MDATLTYAANVMAWVIGDATVANNGIYQKSGASGSGSWTRLGDLPYSFIKATDAGAGTSNAIVATTSTPIPDADGAALIALNIFETNTASPVTVAFDSGSPLTIKNNAGEDLKAGDLKAGMIVSGYVSGSTFRLINNFGVQFLLATNTGGTNAITATTPTSVPTGDGQAMIVLPISATNTATPVTVSFNGGAPLTIVTTGGDAVGVGGLSEGSIVTGYKSGANFRLISGMLGWSPIIRAANDGERRVLAVADWVGGEGLKPVTTGYIGLSGLVANIADALDVRGPSGTPGAGTGDMVEATYDPQGVAGDVFAGDFKALWDINFVGDGTTNDTSAFSTLELARTGISVDLGGRTYLVTAIPNGNDYYNGAFKVGTEIYRRHRNPRSHPFETPAPTVKFVDPKPRVYRGLNVAQFPLPASGTVVYLWREAPGHGNEDTGTRLLAARTDDMGNTFKLPTGAGNSGSEQTLAFRQADCDIRNFAAGTMNARLGVMAARVNPDNSHQDPVFIYSDDSGVTWSSAVVTAAAATTNFHSRIYPYPASAGGDDTDGFICYFYRSGAIGAMKTTDNGASWTEVADIVLPAGSFGSVSEMSVARIGTQSKWIMGIRTDSGENMAVAVSSDMTTWSAIGDSGLKLGSNPPELLYEDGKIFAVCFSRRDKPIVAEFDNALVIASANPDTVYNASGVGGWSGWLVVTALPFFPTGYIAVEKIRGRYYGLFNCEDYAGSTQSRTGYLMLLSSDPVPTASYPAILKMRPNPNLCFNGAFRLATLGETFTGTTRKTVLDGFTFSRTSNAGGWTITRTAGDKSRYAMRVRRDDADSGTQAMNLAFVLPMEDSMPLRNQQVTLSFRARKAAGFSAANSFLTTQLRQTNHASEQVVTNAAGTFGTGDTAVGTSSSGVTLTENWQTFRLTPAKLDADINQIMVRWLWTPVGTAADDYFDIELVKLEIGADATPFEFGPYHLEKERCGVFTQTFTARSANGEVFVPFIPRMHRAPAVTVSAGSASNITAAGFLLTHNAAADCTVTAIATL